MSREGSGVDSRFSYNLCINLGSVRRTWEARFACISQRGCKGSNLAVEDNIS